MEHAGFEYRKDSIYVSDLNVISKAISEDWAVVSGKVGIIPVGFQLDTLKYIITSSEYLRSLLVSVTVPAIGTTLGLLVLGMTAYPLSKPVYATIALFMAVFYWNSYIEPMLYINSTNLRPVQLYLRDIVPEQSNASSALGQTVGDKMNVSPEGFREAAIIAATIPILAMYPFVQKYFLSGITIGSVRG